jgi:NAD(P)-dependent dehydrogenase (short-subunit alcohol dehydrogenase family)
MVGVSTGAVSFPEKFLVGHSSYVVAKIAIIKLMQMIGVENPDVRTVTIHPGVIETQMYTKAELPGLVPDSIHLAAHFTLWVTSDEARFANGRFLWLNWDVDELKANAKKIEESPDLFRVTIGGWPYQPLI